MSSGAPVQNSCCAEGLPQALSFSNSPMLNSCFSLWWYHTRECLNWSISQESRPFRPAGSWTCSHQPHHHLLFFQNYLFYRTCPQEMKMQAGGARLPVTPQFLLAFPGQLLAAPPVPFPSLASVTHALAHPGKRGLITVIQQDWFAPRFSSST